MPFRREPGVLIDANGNREAASRGEMFHQRRGDWRLLPEAHALREIASIVGERHGKAQQVEFGVPFRGHFVEHRLLAIDLCLDGGLRFVRGNGVADFQQAAETARDCAPLLAVVPADAANRADRDAILRPKARIQGEAKHGPQDIGVARFTPHDAADLGIDIGRHERGDGRVMTSHAKREIILKLLLGCKAGAQDVPPTGENSPEAIRRAAEFDEPARLGLRELRFEKWGGAPDL